MTVGAALIRAGARPAPIIIVSFPLYTLLFKPRRKNTIVGRAFIFI